jgi:hypothetical protein
VRGAGYSSSSVEVKNGGIIPPPPYAFMAWCLINQAQGECIILYNISFKSYACCHDLPPMLSYNGQSYIPLTLNVKCIFSETFMLRYEL